MDLKMRPLRNVQSSHCEERKFVGVDTPLSPLLKEGTGVCSPRGRHAGLPLHTRLLRFGSE